MHPPTVGWQGDFAQKDLRTDHCAPAVFLRGTFVGVGGGGIDLTDFPKSTKISRAPSRLFAVEYFAGFNAP